MIILSFYFNFLCWNFFYFLNGWVVMGICEMNCGGRGVLSVLDYVKVILVCFNFLILVCLLVNYF